MLDYYKIGKCFCRFFLFFMLLSHYSHLVTSYKAHLSSCPQPWLFWMSSHWVTAIPGELCLSAPTFTGSLTFYPDFHDYLTLVLSESCCRWQLESSCQRGRNGHVPVILQTILLNQRESALKDYKRIQGSMWLFESDQVYEFAEANYS